MPTLSIDSIIVERDRRVRKEVQEADVDSLAESIGRLNYLIHPIVIDTNRVLVAGETRLRACKKLGWTEIEVRYADTLDEKELLAIELEENVKRRDLPWQDQCTALRRFHDLQVDIKGPEWTQSKTAEAIGYSPQIVAEQLAVADQLLAGNARVSDALKLSTAIGISRRVNERTAADVKAGILEVEGIVPKEKTAPLLNMDFMEWANTYDGRPFNFIHCDFPYGVSIGDNAKHKLTSGKDFGTYDDSPEVAKALEHTLFKHRAKILGESCHLMFWFSMHGYQEKLDWLRSFLWVDVFPLVWNKQVGVIPNANLGPRRIYETCFLCSYPREAPRNIIQATSNVFTGVPVKEVGHMSEKSIDMLMHFMKMFVDGNTRMLDPTCGSGNACRAATRLGAHSVLGIEKEKEFFDLAVAAWNEDDV